MSTKQNEIFGENCDLCEGTGVIVKQTTDNDGATTNTEVQPCPHTIDPPEPNDYE